jgi:hypothetical protein
MFPLPSITHDHGMERRGISVPTQREIARQSSTNRGVADTLDSLPASADS